MSGTGLDPRMPEAPWLLDRAPYTPFMEPRTTHPPGLMPLDPQAWTVHDADFAPQCAYRDRLIAERPEIVLGFAPRAADAARELLGALSAHHVARSGAVLAGDVFRRADGAEIPLSGDPMAAIGRLGAEDWCVLLPGGDEGEYLLAAAALCFPARWRLSEKMGRPLTAIHDPVPDYDGTLARRVNRVFTALRADRPLFRINWIVYATPEPHLPVGEEAKGHPSFVEGEDLYLRTERQTLVRLPHSGAVIFGIKTSITPLDRLAVAEASALHAAFASLSSETVTYRTGAERHRHILSMLSEIAGQGAAV